MDNCTVVVWASIKIYNSINLHRNNDDSTIHTSMYKN
jgi:hypothetical protein